MWLPVNWGAKIPQKTGSKNLLEHRRVSGIPASLQSATSTPGGSPCGCRGTQDAAVKHSVSYNFKFGPYLHVEANQQSGTAFPPSARGATQTAPSSVGQLGDRGNNPNLPSFPQASLHFCWFPSVKSASLEPSEATGRLLCVYGLGLDLIL